MQICIYQDYIHNNGVLHKRLCADFGAENVRYIDAEAIIDGGLSGVDMLVMPGGADLYYCEKLNGAGNDAIKSFVNQGGIYFGICAGAYYACRAIIWAEGSTQQISGTRELAFHSGMAVGPIYEFIEDGMVEKSWKNIVAIEADGQKTDVYYEAGPLFEETADAHILARYSALPGTPPAIIETNVGAGLAILSSPHIEYGGSDLKATLYENNNPSAGHDLALLSKQLPENGLMWQTIITRIKNNLNTEKRYAA